MASSVDREWFLSVLDSHQRLIHKVCWAYANSPDERDDLFQEIAVRLLSAARNYDPTRKLSTWIYRVALNVAIDSHRKRRQRSKEQLGFDGDLEPASGRPTSGVRWWASGRAPEHPWYIAMHSQGYNGDQ